MLENRPEDALASLVETEETVETVKTVDTARRDSLNCSYTYTIEIFLMVHR